MSMGFLWCSIAYSRTISVSGDNNAADLHVSAGILVLVRFFSISLECYFPDRNKDDYCFPV